jgi:hypothetical protein
MDLTNLCMQTLAEVERDRIEAGLVASLEAMEEAEGAASTSKATRPKKKAVQTKAAPAAKVKKAPMKSGGGQQAANWKGKGRAENQDADEKGDGDEDKDYDAMDLDADKEEPAVQGPPPERLTREQRMKKRNEAQQAL